MKRFTPVLLTRQPLAASEAKFTSDEMAGTLNGLMELWQPALMPHWLRPPEPDLAQNHVEPQSEHYYVLPKSMPLGLAEDWADRARRAGSLVVTAEVDRSATRRALLQAIDIMAPMDAYPSFYGLGFGYLILGQLADAMGHGNALDTEQFLSTVQDAAAHEADDDGNQKLAAAAELLRAARDVLYPSTLYLLDLALLDAWPEDSLLQSLDLGLPFNVIASGEGLTRWQQSRPNDLARLKERIDSGQVELCGGHFRECPEVLLPAEDRFANVRQGWQSIKQLLGVEPKVYARCRFGASPLDAELASAIGQRHILLQRFDDSKGPDFKGAVLEWPATAGQSVIAFTRRPDPADAIQSWFYLARKLHESIVHDFTAIISHVTHGPIGSWHRDWLALHRLAPVFGQHLTFSTFFAETYANEHPPSLDADQFRTVELSTYCQANEQALCDLARSARIRRHFEAGAAAAGMLRGLSRPDVFPLDSERLFELDDQLARGERPGDEHLRELHQSCAGRLAERIIHRATEAGPGHLVINPCSFTRRVVVDLPGVTTPLPAPARATQVHEHGAVASVELPPFGFSWLPLAVSAGAKIHQPRMNMLNQHLLRNEFLEAEIDEQTGSLRELRDSSRKIGRLGVQIVLAAGSQMRLRDLKPESNGMVRSSVRATGDLLDADGRRLAGYALTYQLEWGVPFLKLRTEIDLPSALQGDGWSNYIGLRFAWRDSAARLTRSIGWSRAPTQAERFEAADFVEIASGPVRTAILTGGLPFVKKHGPRMADLLLVTPGEATRTFDVALAVERDEPLLTVEDWLTPALVIPVPKGPPPGGPTGWLFDLDAAHVLVTSLHPARDGSDAVILRLVECRGISGEAQLRCPRQPVRAEAIDDRGEIRSALTTVDDTVFLHFAAHEAARIRVTFGT